jgi:Zn-dependent protease with chaperone function
MAPVLFIAAICLLGLPGAARRFGRRLDPAEWSRFSVAALAAGAVLLEISVLLYAAPTVLRAAGVPHLADLCERALGAVLPGGAVLGWPAAAMAILFPILTGVGAGRARRAQQRVQVEPWLGDHHRADGYDLIVLPTGQILAFSVGGPTPQIVISQGLVDTLSHEEVDAVVRHEAAHLEHRHQRLLLLASALEQGLPLARFLRRSTTALRTGLERWADETAAGASHFSRNVLRGALVGVCAAAVHPAVAAFSAEALVERLDALDSGPPRPSPSRRLVTYGPALLIGVVVLGALGMWRVEAVHLVAHLTRHCLT